MTQYKAVPQAPDQRNVSQVDILNNFNYLCQGLGSAVTPQGILGVDHFASADNVANPVDGFHNQISYKNKSPVPTFGVNPVNMQTPDAVTWTFADTNAKTQLVYQTSLANIQLTSAQVPVAAIAGQSFFPTVKGSSSILVQWGQVSGLPITTPVSFPTNFSSANLYSVQITMVANAGGPNINGAGPLVKAGTLTASGFSILCSWGKVTYYWLAIGPA